jgi:DNA invertase Pin-like site-specific DNA recombinase
MRFIGYVRVSRVAGREGDSFISPTVQREKIEQYLAAQGHALVDWAEDLDQPGSKYGRPGFQRALEAVENGEADGIAVAALDRFARSVPDAAVALRRLEQAGGALVSVMDALDTTTSVGRFARTMMLGLAELELDRTRENWRVAREHAVARGVHIARTPIFGYRRREDGGLEPDPKEAKVARELFRRRAAGEEWRSLARWLDEVAPRENDGAWIASSIRSLIRSRTYLGVARSGDIENGGAHKPLVPRSLWEAAQENRPPSNRRGESEPALLAGLVRCAACRYVAPRSAEPVQGSARYQCHGKHATGRCPAPSKVSTALLDAYVEGVFLEELARTPIEVEGSEDASLLDAALAQLEEAESELTAYRDAAVIASIGRAAFVAGLQKRAADVDAARAEVAREQAKQERGGSLGRRALVDAWPNLSPVERREQLGAAIDAVFVRRGDPASRGSHVDVAPRVHIAWRGEAPLATLPGRGRRLPLGPFVFPDESPHDAGVLAA